MPINLYIENDRGLVWNPTDILQLRKNGLLGATVGGIAEFKQQNEVLGPPLELSIEEVTYALETGLAQAAGQPRVDVTSGATSAQQAAQGAEDASDDDSLPDVWMPLRQHVPAWRSALNAKELLRIDECSSSAGAVRAAVWGHPCTLAEQQHYHVFRDLRRRGFMMSNGLKFGGHYLAYPGDPHLYHAQFVVRVAPTLEALQPQDLAAACRAAAGARKQLLLASPVRDESEVWTVKYTTATPEAKER